MCVRVHTYSCKPRRAAAGTPAPRVSARSVCGSVSPASAREGCGTGQESGAAAEMSEEGCAALVQEQRAGPPAASDVLSSRTESQPYE